MDQQELFSGGSSEQPDKPMTGTDSEQLDLNRYVKELQRLSVALKRLRPMKTPLDDTQLEAAIRKAVDATKACDLLGLLKHLESKLATAAQRSKATVDQRREVLLAAAKASSMPHKRFTEYDRVGPFKVTYRGKKTRLELGSEVACEFDVADGAAVLARIRQVLAELEAWPFDRDHFFRMIKDGLRLARERGQERDGWVPVRALYPHVALLQNLQFEDFMRQPTARRYHDYTAAQFAYDLARFGRRGWSCGDDSLRARTPNMATVSAGKAITLPNLEAPDKAGEQFASLRIERGGPSGAKGGSGAAS